MNCARFTQVLDAHIDGELDHATTRDITAHLAACPACSTLREQRIQLQQAMRAHSPRFKAPPALAPVIRRALEHTLVQTALTAKSKPRASWRAWLPTAAFAAVAALAGVIGGYWLAQTQLQPQPDYPLRDPAVASHVAALAPTRQLIQVASSDRHTVKPWFQGKVDFAPPVKDLKDEGFVLVGGRLDQVADKPAAAVVYQIRKHVINLFVWRAGERAPDAMVTTNVRGFSVTTWASNGLRFAAVSDLDARDLTRFATLVSEP